MRLVPRRLAGGEARAQRQRGDALTRARRAGRLTRAEYSLQRARSLFHLAQVRARWGRVRRVDPRGATLILLDLAVNYERLSPADRARADVLLARPTQGANDPDGQGYQAGTTVQNSCSANFCLHWVTTTSDAVATADANANSVPDYIDQAQLVLDNVWNVEINTLGFHAPKSDLSSPDNGGDAKLDVYFADVGADDLFGFCGSDDPDIQNIDFGKRADISGYCVLDNDYSSTQFQDTASLAAMEVTAAHEFFHAVQFGYDALEDQWLMEGSAVWMEDVVYDDINDYYSYLQVSQMAAPSIPLDYSRPSSDDSLAAQSKYGASLFFHFLSDAILGTPAAPDRSFMLDLWEHADSTHGDPNNQYSLQALQTVFTERGKDFTDAYALFGVANLFPSSFYGEGAAYANVANVPVTLSKVSAAHPSKSFGGKRDHLTQAYGDFRPGKGVKSSSKLRVIFNGPPTARGAAGTYVVLTKTGGTYKPFSLNAAGDATVKTAFGKGKVTDVVVILTNASTALTCLQDFAFSCQGRPSDDDLQFTVTGKLLK
jgi:hypothetical protein